MADNSNIIPFTPKNGGNAHVFTFGEPVPVIDKDIADYTGAFLDFTGSYYTPPVSLLGLAKIMNANAYHGSILRFKMNMLSKWYDKSPLLSLRDFRAAALDFVVFDNCYFQKFYNGLGRVVRLERRPAIAMRRAKPSNKFIELPSNDFTNLLDAINPVEYQEDEIVHLKGPDLRQSIYGIPEYLGGLQAVLLSENATLFRRKYYINGAHMGYVMVTNGSMDEDSAKAVRECVMGARGIGNFHNLYLNFARADTKDPVQVHPIGDIKNNDDYLKVKETTQAELLVMHRLRPELLGIIPQNTGGFADPIKTTRVYYELEIQPQQQVWLEINDMIGREAVKFKDFVWQDSIGQPVPNPK